MDDGARALPGAGRLGAARVGRLTETDAAVIARSVRRPEHFARVFDRHWEAIRRYCVSRVGAAGEDLAAEVFGIAFSRRRRYDRGYPDAGPWLHGIATNLIRRHFRQAAMAATMEPPAGAGVEPDLAEAALSRVEAEALGPRLARALGALSDTDRDALLLLAWGGLSYEEIAIALDVPVGTVGSRVHRGRARMRARLETPEDGR